MVDGLFEKDLGIEEGILFYEEFKDNLLVATSSYQAY